MMDLIERTWDELGFRVRATGWKVWVRTRPHPRKWASLWLPPKAASFYGDLPHLRTVYATVLTAGPRGMARTLKPGDVIAFQRLHFAWMNKLEPTTRDEYGADEEYVGYVNAEDVLYVVEEVDGVYVARDPREVQVEAAL